MAGPVLEMRGISKRFGMTEALSGISIALRPGEIHALVGENGAGKSTLIKIMTGLHQPSAGEVLVEGRPVTLRGTQDAQRAGIAAIYQEPMVFPDLDVAENIFISHRDLGPVVRWRALRARARAVVGRIGVALDVERAAGGLTLAEQQTVEIARAISLDARALIMDEPTASLSVHEVRELMGVARALKRAGVAILYISHRLEEVFELADRVSVLRDGRLISTGAVAEMTRERLVADMVGRALAAASRQVRSHARDEVLLAVRGLGREGAFRDVSFELGRGEVLCFAGLIGARRTDVALALFGIAPADRGEIEVAGAKVAIASPRAAMDLGIAYVSEDRRKLGLALAMPVTANVTLATLRAFLSRMGLIDRAREARVAEDYRGRLNIRMPGVSTAVGQLSGGNQQKVMLAKWLHAGPRILILDEPTRGIDVGAKAELHAIVHALAADGVAVMVISSDLPEVLALADRVAVMREGRLMGIFPRAEATQERIMGLATGSHRVAEPA